MYYLNKHLSVTFLLNVFKYILLYHAVILTTC